MQPEPLCSSAQWDGVRHEVMQPPCTVASEHAAVQWRWLLLLCKEE